MSDKNFLDEFIKNVKELQDHNEKLKKENIKLREELNHFKSNYDFNHKEVKELSKQLYELIHNISHDNILPDDKLEEDIPPPNNLFTSSDDY